MSGTVSPVVERPVVATDVVGFPGGPPVVLETSPDRPVRRSEAFTRLAANIFLGARLEDAGLRRLGIDRSSALAAGLAAAAGVGLRFFIPVAITAAAGQWAGAPWWSWALIAVVLGASDALGMHRHRAPDASAETMPSGPRRLLADFTALVETIERDDDVRQLAMFVRRWYRLPVSVAIAAAVALTILLTCLLVSPDGVRALPVGSLAVLALLLYDFGELAFQNLFAVPFMARMADFDHRLFWASPVDSAAVRSAMRVWATMQFMVGIGVTLSLVLAIVVVGLDSALVLPLAASFVMWGYLTTFASMLGVRASVRRIVERIRDRNLAALQRRIDAYGSHFAELPRGDAEDVARLIALHATIRDAPTAPATSRTLVHAVVALVIPTVMFIVTVFGEVLAERLLESALP
jgi:hypothetical protein